MRPIVIFMGVLAFAGIARAENFQATLNGASEVPPKTSPGTGTLTATVDPATRALSYKVEYQGLTGPATAAHFHGPADPGVNAGVVIPAANPASPITGTATLTPDQLKEFQDGKMYFNVHTAANPGGEIRGQVHEAK